MKFKSKVANIKVLGGSNNDSTTVHIEKGRVLKCALFINSDVPSEIVNVKIEDANTGDELHPFITYHEYQPTNGNHLDSRKDLHFDGNREIKITAQAKDDLKADFIFQMVFYYDQE